MDDSLKIKLYSFTLDCTDPYGLAKFYAALLGWEIPYHDEDFARLGAPGAAQGVYPSGLVVGTVMSLEEDPGGLTRSAILTPAADLNTLSQVFVVTAFWEER